MKEVTSPLESTRGMVFRLVDSSRWFNSRNVDWEDKNFTLRTMMSSTKMLYLLEMTKQKHMFAFDEGMTAERVYFCFFCSLPDVPEGQLRQVRQLLHLDDGVVEGRLQALGHHVG